jgi:tetratricopeptide (TPR) repeat protein
VPNALVLVVAISVAAHAPAPRRAQPDVRLTEASRALSAGDVNRALQLGQAYVKDHPSEARARVLLARVYIQQEAFEQAYLELQQAMHSSRTDADVLYYIGHVTARLAEGEFNRLASLAPDSARVHQLQAEALEAQDQRTAAEREYEAALKVNPDLLEALLPLGKLKRIRLACEEAIPLYEKAEVVRATFDGAYGLGICQSYLQNDEAAIVQFEQAIRRDPKAAVAWVGLGTSLMKLQRPADAIVKLQQAISLEPRMGEAYYALGMAYQATRQPDLAQQAFRKAEQLGGATGSGPDGPPLPAGSPKPR